MSDIVRDIALTLEKPRTIEYIAEQAGVSVEKTRKEIESLLDEGYVRKEEEDYRTNMIKIYEERVTYLYENKTSRDIRKELETVKSKIKSIKDRHNVKNIAQMDDKVRKDDYLNEDYRREMSKELSRWKRLINRKHILLEALDRKND